MKVCIQDTSNGPIGSGGEQHILEMPACPRVGETVFVTEDIGVAVKTVLWTPYWDKYDVQVRCW